MLIGCPKEIKEYEDRVALTPAAVHELVSAGNVVLVEHGAGHGSGISDDDFICAGAKITKRITIFDKAEMIVKVKQPSPEEIDILHEGQILFTYLHLAADKELTKRLLGKKIIAIGYETVELADGSLPLLAPMSAISGRLAIQIGAHYLEGVQGGEGVLLGGAPGVAPAEVVILGSGVVALNATKVAIGMGAHVTVIGIRMDQLSYFGNTFGSTVSTLMSTAENITAMVKRADLLIGAVLVAGARAPRLVTHDMVKTMKAGSVIVDSSIDQGGCVETEHPTTHGNPTFTVDGVIHYCATNIPALTARTSTLALSNATLPYIMEIARDHLSELLASNEPLRKGVNIYRERLTCLGVSKSLDIPYTPLEKAIRESK